MGANQKPYRSCAYLESGITCFPHEIVFCCDRQSPASIRPMKTASDTVDAFLETRERIIRENQGDNPPCEKCSMFQTHTAGDGSIQYLNFSTHSYCQFSCIYCGLQNELAQDKNAGELYDGIEIAQELKKRGMLSKQLRVDCAPGEIAVHPRRNEYYDFIEENAASVTFFSNAGKYDERIAEILCTSKQNSLIVSVDAGTRETFQLVHGVDVFSKVIENLRKYRKSSANIIVKYIILDENCDEKELRGFIALCKDIGISHIAIAADSRKSWNYNEVRASETQIVHAAVSLIELAITGGISFDIYSDYFGQINMREIYRCLVQNPVFVSAEQALDRILSHSKVIAYGAGRNANYVLGQLKSLGVREPDILWDIQAKSSSECRFGYPIYYPDFDSLNSGSDVGILITITNSAINQDLLASMQKCGFTNAISYDRLALALMAKQARKAMGEKAAF